MRIKAAVKSIVPDFIINILHYYYSLWGSIKYDHPSEEILVIGVTGTSGKSSTIHFLRQILEEVGYSVGSVSTADFYINGEQKLNDRKMTMLGRGENHKFLRRMVNADCDIAILETTSEGALQHRHKFINYDSAIFTNLYREHIEAHGGFENYKQCKLNILDYISKCRKKYWHKEDSTICAATHTKAETEREKIPKTIITSANNEHTVEALDLDFEQKIVFSRNDKKEYLGGYEYDKRFLASDNAHNNTGVSFIISDTQFDPKIYGKHNIWNLLAGIAATNAVGVDLREIKTAVDKINPPPGRIEFIDKAEKYNFRAIVDYAFEPNALKALYDTIDIFESNKIIHVCGSAGGGRDTWRREEIGKIVANKADQVIVTNEDPYDEDPIKIIKQVAEGVKQENISQDNLYLIKNRSDAIKKAVELVGEDDLLLVTGKGSEQGIIEQGEFIPWDDRKVVKEKITEVYES